MIENPQSFVVREECEKASWRHGSKIREEWFNGKAYYRLHGRCLENLPANPAQHPAPPYLQWHNEQRFQG